ncbi:MAG: pyridoxamine 5'-phosphate oxidase family protein [Acidimicrobiales bacterium]
MTSPLTMSRSEREAFLADLRVGVLAVAAADGQAPLAAPVWYRYEPGGEVLISTGATSLKAQVLAAAGRASLCAPREQLPYAFVTVDGPVTLAPSDEEERIRLAQRYLGDELATTYIESTAGSENVLVRLTPERWRTQDYTKLPSG